jgi:hypothetical protein
VKGLGRMSLIPGESQKTMTGKTSENKY